MTLTIRPGSREDLPQVVDIYNHSGLEHDAVLTLADAEKWFSRVQQYPNYTLWVACFSEKVVGTFALLIMDNLVHHGSPSGIVEAVGVAPDLQGQGIGRRMMDIAIARCRSAGCYKLTISTNLRRTAAHAFYESLGFTQHGYSYRVKLS
ncbi:GNAT family N-acetyltransferase [Leptolyngbyaceae cyanobacterium CCMR0082]|uniref:GNAT family N-acetyltransferase n=1 Tax=Adonisia turfae CCMR0082 TaxID=2304604 RepID=A0A6M0SGZ1_9CYAN|nr:GNAT family N-acetyltransferase [Adonisia turfae]NEZ67201.1 GNAT family N-acetyltransferase [Adonisia turfae CCMR0082]